MKRLLITLTLLFSAVTRGPAAHAEGDGAMPTPGDKAKCPVCGTFVGKLRPWLAAVVHQDGEVRHFDGPRDLFKYLHDVPRWAPRHTASDVREVLVTDYYSLKAIDARTALYVIGSDVRGPTGAELVPVGTRTEAEALLREHKGKRILTYREVTPALLKKL